ncbi:PIG-L deacetylase family protein [Gemmatimonadota bacterium]
MRKSLPSKGFTWLIIVSMAVFIFSCGENVRAQAGGKSALRVIMIGAHPDDTEGKGGGTAALWAATGAKVMMVSVTNGDAGHQSEGGGALAQRRAEECRAAARILGVNWSTLDFHDGELEPNLAARSAVIRAIREWQADIVITHRPCDYHPDHRYTGQIVQDAAYMVVVPNICPDTPRLEKNPVFMYFADRFQKPYPTKPDVVVDITPVIDKKLRAFDVMPSQMYEWLPWVGGRLDQVPKNPAERFEWLKKRRSGRTRGWKNKYADIVEARYGKARSEKIDHIEVFELCEYGRQPNREELWGMFPK